MKIYLLIILSLLVFSCSNKTTQTKKTNPHELMILNNMKTEKIIRENIKTHLLLHSFSWGVDLYNGSTQSECALALLFDSKNRVYHVDDSLGGTLINKKTGKHEAEINYTVKTGSYKIIKKDIFINLNKEYTFTKRQDGYAKFIKMSNAETKKTNTSYVMNLISFINKNKKGMGLRDAKLSKSKTADFGTKYNLWVKMKTDELKNIKFLLGKFKK